PGNVALAVGNDVVYIKVKEGDEHLILAEALLPVLKEPPQVVERMLGRDLVGLDYEPLYPYSVPQEGRAHYVVDADFVSVDEGTGVVHTSALYGVDDLRLCQEETILHTYPFCWRCGTPLIYYALDAWYIRTTARKDDLIANNNATNWV